VSGEPEEHRQAPSIPEAQARPIRFSLIWLIPVVVLAIGAYLAWQTISRRGAEITIEFDSADGITAGQTQVKQKAVTLGTVQGVELSHDLQHVEVRVQMSAQSTPLLTDHAKFWVVRPRLSGASITGLETLVSGAYIGIDPGSPGGTAETKFQGLDAPPGVRSDEPGSVFTLTTGALGSIGQGSPVFFRDVTVGEVLGYKMPPDGRGPIAVQVFVKAPYDKFLRRDTRFWDVSGVSVDFSGGNLHFQIESLQALVSGGVAFGLPVQRRRQEAPKAAADEVFKLYMNKEAADNAGYSERFHLVTYLRSSVKGLDIGSPVVMFGVQVGNVTDVKLLIDQDSGNAQVRVAMEVQPERILADQELPHQSVFSTTQALVNRGLRAETDTSNLLTGASMISLTFVPKAKPVAVVKEGDAIVVPSQAGGLTGITDSLSTVADKLAALPIEQIGDNLNSLLAHTDATVGGPELKRTLVELDQTLASLRQLSNNASQDLTPVLKRLPAIADQLQHTIGNANTALAAYGGKSDFHNSLQQTLGQLNETARSIRALVDYLNRHPSSLIFGRSHP
jgi:paraquat-inducible protein B